MQRGFGFRPDPEPEKYRRFGARRGAGVPRATEERFDDLVRRVRDQGMTNSCVGNSGAAGVEVRRALDGQPYVPISASALYWEARALDGWENEDSGAMIRSAAKVAHAVGVASEAAWPFDVARINERPDYGADVEGVARADGTYERIFETGADRVEAVLDALQARCPVWFGTEVDEQFMRATGADTIPAPGVGDRMLGGHALLACGMANSGERIRIVNSYGLTWGDSGFGWLAAEWFERAETSDVVVLRPRKVEVPNA